jgi:hypothetical protein
VRLYTRTLRSEQAVATIGRVGCGAVCHVRELDGGVSVARGASVYCRDSVISEGRIGIKVRSIERRETRR